MIDQSPVLRKSTKWPNNNLYYGVKSIIDEIPILNGLTKIQNNRKLIDTIVMKLGESQPPISEFRHSNQVDNNGVHFKSNESSKHAE